MAAVTSNEDQQAPLSHDPPPPDEKLGFFGTMGTFPRSFWMGCGIEMWERLAWYGTRVVLPVYIAQADLVAGLHFTQAQKGTIYAWWALVQGLLPTLTGGLADRYGYKKTLAVYATINISAFILMANVRSYGAFFAACLLLGVGTALFKPAIQGTLAQSMTKRNSSVGWGFFYVLVNIGGVLGPSVAGLSDYGWKVLFYSCAGITSLNYLMLFTYPSVESGADKTKPLTRTLVDTFKNLRDLRLVAVIAIFTGFWMMLYQLWDFMPSFFTDWTETGSFAQTFSFLPTSWFHDTNRGVQLKQQYALNLNALLIVLFAIPMSYFVRKQRVLTVMTVGFAIATVGTFVYGTSPAIFAVYFGIFLFSTGEMMTGPKKTEYFALIAPPGKKALYLGYVNIPVALGQGLGAKIAGSYYGTKGEKATLALRYLAEKTDYVKDKGAWDGNVENLQSYVGVERKQAFTTLISHLHSDGRSVNQVLWDTYQPYTIWYVFAAVGAVSLVGMVVYARVSKRWKEMDV